jgi:hypothetical protein
MAGTPPIVQTKRIENTVKVHISFTVPTRLADYLSFPVGMPHPMLRLSIIYSVNPRDDCHFRIVYNNFHMLGASRDLSYFQLRQLEVGESNVVQTTEMALLAGRTFSQATIGK